MSLIMIRRLPFISCGRKICVCRKEIFNFYMKKPLFPSKHWTDELNKKIKNKSSCTGSYIVMVNNLEREYKY